MQFFANLNLFVKTPLLFTLEILKLKKLGSLKLNKAII